MDDTFVIIDTDKLSNFHIALNNALPGIQFTLDKEKDSNLPFLDILIHRLPTGTLETSVYSRVSLAWVACGGASVHSRVEKIRPHESC